MFGNNGKEDQVIKLAKGIVAGHHDTWDVAYMMAYFDVYGRCVQRVPSSVERKIWKCQDYRTVSYEEYQAIKRAYYANSR